MGDGRRVRYGHVIDGLEHFLEVRLHLRQLLHGDSWVHVMVKPPPMGCDGSKDFGSRRFDDC